MFKKNIYLIIFISLFTGCVEKNPEIISYDLSNYWFNMKSLNDNKTILSKSLISQYNDGVKSDEYEDFTLYKKDKTNVNQIEVYTFFEDINSQNFKAIISEKNADLKYDILKNEINEIYVPENQISNYKRYIKVNDKVIEEKFEGSVFSCRLSNYYEKINVKDKINTFFNKKYSTEDKSYKDVMELLCNDTSVDGEYFIFMAKDIGNIFYMRKDKTQGSLEEAFSILESQTILE